MIIERNEMPDMRELDSIRDLNQSLIPIILLSTTLGAKNTHKEK